MLYVFPIAHRHTHWCWGVVPTLLVPGAQVLGSIVLWSTVLSMCQGVAVCCNARENSCSQQWGAHHTHSYTVCDVFVRVFSFAYIPTIGLHATLGVLLHVVTEMQIHTLQTALRQYMHCKLHQSNYVRCKVHRSRAHTSTWSWSFVVVLLLASLSHLHRQPPHCSSSCNHCHHCCGCGHHTCTQ